MDNLEAQIQQKERQLALMQNQQTADANTGNSQSNQTLQSLAVEQQEKSMSEEQLDLDKIIVDIENLLRARLKVKGDRGAMVWEEQKDSKMKILSEYGIQLIINTIRFYLNKNTLLSNYDDKTILEKMEDFSTDLTDTIFMEYENIFYYPTFEDCKKVLEERLMRKKEIKMFAIEILGKEVDDKKELDIEVSVLDEIEGRVEYELEKIKQQLIKDKLKRFALIIRTLQDSVHSTYLRAWKGQERTTLRQHIHISESRNPLINFQQPQNKGFFGFMKNK